MQVHFGNREFRLSNEVSIPCIGFGTWRIPDGEVAVKSVSTAISCGYSHIDTAAIYGNEKSVGAAIEKNDVERSDLFVTTKLWDTEHNYEKAIKAFRKSLDDLGTDYADLYLIHWPTTLEETTDCHKINLDAWKALEYLYRNGEVRAIGVSNFLVEYLEPLLEKAEIIPMVNQIEFHIGQVDSKTVELCNKNDILIEAWGPLGGGEIVNHPALIKIAEKYDISVAQLCLRWCLQNNTLPLVKSVSEERIKNNIDVFDFSITDDDMDFLNNMEYIGGSGLYFEKFRREEYRLA
ncbi:MAG: aldo/keto reductase [Holosporaceae bacterium]|jgi:diketogulonate reductase-like aldo/keto reductase|nr:aldo/keto reductase [Holosporaceae bacterium]